MSRRIITAIFLLISFNNSFAQSPRINTNNQIGWYNYFGTFKLSGNLGLHTEYQWRRNELVKEPQQGLLRVGLNYQHNARLLLRAGYAWIETLPYGDIPLNSLGKDFTEHRIYEMAQLSHKEGIFDFAHRYMLEQRFVGTYSSVAETKEDNFPLLHRMRYMARIQVPLKGRTIERQTPYLALYDEIMIGFGKNVSNNVFDQNRIGILAGYNFNQNLKLEAGYINQVVQYGRRINDQNVFQRNNGIIINANFNFDLRK